MYFGFVVLMAVSMYSFENVLSSEGYVVTCQYTCFCVSVLTVLMAESGYAEFIGSKVLLFPETKISHAIIPAIIETFQNDTVVIHFFLFQFMQKLV